MGQSTSKQSVVLQRLLDKYRPVLVFGTNSEDSKVIKQRHSWVGALPEAGIKDRDLIVVEVLGQGAGKVGVESLNAGEADELRSVFSVAGNDFAVVLIGRDGEEKCRWVEPVSAQEIFGKVDGMPMRVREVQARGGGSE